MKRNNAQRRARGGFTLVEMLVVLGILVLLASLVVPRILGSQKQADIKAAKAQIGMLKNALERYAVDCKDFPYTEQGLYALTSAPADLPMTVTWGGPYLNGELPADPWGSEYQYEYPPTRGSGDYPDIWSYGPDGEDGTDDDVCSWTTAASGEFSEDMLLDEGAGKKSTSAPPPIESPEPVTIE